MVDETLIDPAGLVKDKTPFKAYREALTKANEFHDKLGLYFHPNTYAHYGADTGQKTYHNVRWRTAVMNYDSNLPAISYSQTDALMKTPATDWDKLGNKTIVKLENQGIRFELLGKDGAGDATVPEPSGAKVAEMGLKLTFEMKGFEHAKSYNNRHVLDNTAYCIARIVQGAKPIKELPQKGTECSATNAGAASSASSSPLPSSAPPAHTQPGAAL
jgi:hypothetical protein